MYISKAEEAREIKRFKDKRCSFFIGLKRFKRRIALNNKNYLAERKQKYKYLLDNINGNSLDEIQREIVLSEEDNTLVIAGAGSGKSLTIIGRILYLVECGVNPNDILCLSFTNMASNNLRKSLSKNGVDMKVYTFHKLGASILRSNGVSINMVDKKVLPLIIDKVLRKHDLLDILPDYDFHDMGTGDFRYLHYLLSLETKEIYHLKDLFSTFINLFKGCNYEIEKFDYFLEMNIKENDSFKRKRNEKLLLLAREIFKEYKYFLDKNRCIDFYDMINKAVNIVEKYGIRNYKYIIIDEYQDTSLVKCELIRAIKDKTGAKLMAVGDDFQSIYQFAGSNLKVFLNFSSFFPHTKIFKLQKTYRNSIDLLNIMGKFILKNKKQIYKRLLSDMVNKYPIYIYYYNKNINEVLGEVLNQVNDDVLILGRNNSDVSGIKPDKGRTMTIHKSKGLEADNVIIVNLEDGINGFPNKIIDDDLLKFVKDDYDDYPYAEERRLFYVAMTRTKNNNYLLVNKNKPSIFVEEIINENPNIKIIDKVFYCPKCQGILIQRNGRYGKFYGCQNYPKCTFTRKVD